MGKVVIDMSMSLDGFVAGPDDSREHGLGRNGGEHVFDWYFSGQEEVRSPLFKPAPGANREQVDLMFEESGAFIFGRRTYDITNGWDGNHPINGVPVFVLTHRPPAASEVPEGPSKLTFVTDGIESAIRKAKSAAGDKDVKLGGASPGKQALEAGLCDEILVHVAPVLLGGGVRLFGEFTGPIKLEQIAATHGPSADHLRFRVLR